MIETSNNEEYLSYLKKHKLPFDKSKIQTVIEQRPVINKPEKAWWGSPVNAEFGWKEWCQCNEMFLEEYDWENPIRWKLKEGSKILRVDYQDVINPNTSLLNKYLHVNDLFKDIPVDIWGKELDFKKIINDEIVAIELMDGSIGHGFRNPLETMFNAWDCESIVVLDETKIEFIEGENNGLE